MQTNLEQREEMYADVTKIDVQQPGIDPQQQVAQVARFRSIDRHWPPADLLLPDSSERMGPRFGDEKNVGAGELFRVLAFLGDDHRMPLAQRGDLSIDVQHLRLQKSHNVLRGDG